MKNTPNAHFDNIATELHPVWRKRVSKPFTCHAVRMQLVAQAAELPEWQRASYIDERLTDLDRALDCDEAAALERWLDCEEMLQGRAKTVNWSGDMGSGSGRASQIPNDAMDALAEHAEIKRRLAARDCVALRTLAMIMQGGQWTLTEGFIGRLRAAARELTKLHSCAHGKSDRP